MKASSRFHLIRAASALASSAEATTVTNDSTIAANKTFDYIIAGAGLTGLTVGNILSAEGYSTLIIEAGPDPRWNPQVYNAEDRVLHDPFCNWLYPGYNEDASQLSVAIDAGACIGGSTSINGMAWIRPSAAEVDKLEELGNPGWNWNSIEPLMTSIERNIAPDAIQREQGAGLDPEVHGFHGLVNVSFPMPMRIPEAVKLYKEALPLAFPGLVLSNDLSNRSADHTVSASTSWTLWHNNITGENLRSSAADGLLWAPDQQRGSLTVLTNHKVGRAILSGSLTTIGVTFGTKPGSDVPGGQPGVHQVYAARDVILAAGALASAAILERESASIYAQLTAPGSLDSRAQALVAAGGAANVAGAKAILNITIDLIVNENFPVAELIGESYPTILEAIFWPLMPLSRGYLHINTSDMFQDPVIVPRFLTDEFDQEVAVAITRRARALFSSTPFAQVVANAYYDPEIAVNGTDAEYLEWYKNTSYGASHWVGTTAMLPRDMGGVVDPQLRVYGVGSLRVVDAGIIPFEITSHPMPLLYAMAQRAAATILSGE